MKRTMLAIGLTMALALSAGASAQTQMQVQTPPVRAATTQATSCLTLANHAYVVEMDSASARSISWWRFDANGTGSGNEVTTDGSPGAGGNRQFTFVCQASAGYSMASPMPVLVTEGGQGGPRFDGHYYVRIAEGGARFAILQTDNLRMAGWGERQ